MHKGVVCRSALFFGFRVSAFRVKVEGLVMLRAWGLGMLLNRILGSDFDLQREDRYIWGLLAVSLKAQDSTPKARPNQHLPSDV